MKNTLLHLKNKSGRLDEGVNPGVKINRIALRVDVGDSDLTNQIKRMFDLAKSSGQELDLTFSQKVGSNRLRAGA